MRNTLTRVSRIPMIHGRAIPVPLALLWIGCSTEGGDVLRHRPGYWLAAVALYLYLPLKYYLLYLPFMEPRLGTWRVEPLGWVAAEWLPLLTLLVAIGFVSRATEIALHAVIAAVFCQGFGFFAAASHRSGFGKSDAIDNPLAYWTIDLLLVALMCAITMTVGFGIGSALRRRREERRPQGA